MQEMYDWYMENLFGEHYKIAVKHAEKDSRDRKKRIAKGGAQKRAPVPTSLLMDADWVTSRMFSQYDGDYSGRSKWERIGSPLTASVVDWGIIINPWGWTNPVGIRTKWRAATRQYDRMVEYS